MQSRWAADRTTGQPGRAASETSGAYDYRRSKPTA
jgi:hypothetical protein